MTVTDLAEYVERSSAVVEESPDLSLRNTQLRLVQPFLSVLGWDTLTDVEAEYAVDDRVVDYALSTEQGVQVLVETVPCGESLTAEDGERLERAMTAAGVDWGILSNGRTFVFVTREGGDLDHRRCDLAALPDNESVLGLFTRTAAADRATADAEARRSDAAAELAADRDAVATDVHEALADHVEAAVDDDLATAADAFVDGVVAALEHGHPAAAAVRTPDGDEPGADEADADADEHTTDTESEATDGADVPAENEADAPSTPDSPSADASEESGSPPEPDETAAADATSDTTSTGTDGSESGRPARRADERTDAPISRSDDPFVVRFFDGSTRIGAVGHATPTAALAGAIEFLFDQRSLAGSLSVPWPQESDRALLNHGPVHPNGEEMARYQQLSNGYYLCTAIDDGAARDALEDLASRAGLRVLFQGDW